MAATHSYYTPKMAADAYNATSTLAFDEIANSQVVKRASIKSG
jgi:hypothetical protein